jgi:hypothetical protein
MRPKLLYTTQQFESKRLDSIIDLDEDTRTIKVYISNVENVYMIVSKAELSMMYACEDNECEVVISNVYFNQPGELTVTVFEGETQIAKETFVVQAYVVCRIPHCIVCVEFFTQFHCLPPQVQAFHIAAVLIMILLSVALIMGVVYLVKRYKFNIQRMDIKPPTNTELLILSLLVCGALGCDDVITLTAEIHDCFLTTNSETCNVVLDALFTLPRPGVELCVRLYDPQQNFLLDAKIRLSHHEVVANLQRMYYTTGYSFSYVSWSQCNWDAGCEDSCPLNSSGVYNVLADPLFSNLNLAGTDNYMAVCMDRGGCWGDDCPSCQEGCAKSVIRLIPIGSTIAEMFRITTAEKHPIVEVDIADQSQEIIFRTNDFVNITDRITIAYESGTFYPYVDEKSVLCELVGSYRCWIRDASLSPVPGDVGELQAANPSVFLTPPYSGMVFNKILFPSPYVQNLAVRWTQTSNFVIGGGRTYLPQTWGLTTWTNVTGSKMFGISTEPFSALFGLELKNYTLTRIRTEVCPQIIDLSASGCHSCDSGFTLKMKASSTCLSGFATLIFDPEMLSSLQVYN